MNVYAYWYIRKGGGAMGRRRAYVFGQEGPRYGRRIFFGLLTMLMLAFLAVFIYNFGLSHQVTYTRQRVTVPDLPGDLENWTILHMSDLHGRYISDGHAAIKSAIGTRACSSVVFTGDMVGPKGDVQPLLDLIALLPAGTPVMYMPGDSDPDITVSSAHSSLSVYADWVVQLQDAGVIILDEPVSFTRNKSTIWFIPEHLYTLDIDNTEAAYQAQVDYYNAFLSPLSADEAAAKRLAEHEVAKMQRLRETRALIGEKDIQICVSHTPLTEEYVRARVQSNTRDQMKLHNADLILAGHYCAGQWRLPGMGAIYVPELGFFPTMICSWAWITSTAFPSTSPPVSPTRIIIPSPDGSSTPRRSP